MSTLDERADSAVQQQRAALTAVLDRQRRSFMADGPPSVAIRRNRIDRLMALVLDNTDAFVDAMAADFGTRSRAATLFTEVIGMISVIEHTRSHVAQWMRATKLMRAVRVCGLRAEVQPSPLEVVGIRSWIRWSCRTGRYRRTCACARIPRTNCSSPPRITRRY
jgi:coniferyl-aldehyde dehydrogenase